MPAEENGESDSRETEAKRRFLFLLQQQLEITESEGRIGNVQRIERELKQIMQDAGFSRLPFNYYYATPTRAMNDDDMLYEPANELLNDTLAFRNAVLIRAFHRFHSVPQDFVLSFKREDGTVTRNDHGEAVAATIAAIQSWIQDLKQQLFGDESSPPKDPSEDDGNPVNYPDWVSNIPKVGLRIARLIYSSCHGLGRGFTKSDVLRAVKSDGVNAGPVTKFLQFAEDEGGLTVESKSHPTATKYYSLPASK